MFLASSARSFRLLTSSPMVGRAEGSVDRQALSHSHTFRAEENGAGSRVYTKCVDKQACGILVCFVQGSVSMVLRDGVDR